MATTSDTPIVQNAQTEAAIAESPFLQSFGDALKNAETEAQAKKSTAPQAALELNKEVAEKQPVTENKTPEKVSESNKKPTLPEFKKEEKATEVTPADDLDVPVEIKSPKAAEQWKTLKREKIAMEKKAADLEAKLASANPAKFAEYETKLKAVEAEKAEFSERLKLLAIERHPDFAKKYSTKLDSVHAQLKAVAGAEGDKLVSLLNSPESPLKAQEIDNIVAGMSPSNQSRYGALVVKLEDINTERSSEIEATKAKFEEFKNGILDQQKNKTVESKARSSQIWEKVSSEARALELFEPKDGDEAWNTEVNQRIQTAQSIFNGESDEEDLAKASLWAAAAPKYREIVYAQNAEISKLKKEIAGYKSSEPGITSSAKEAKTVGESFMDKVLKGI